ncbi:DUF4253 domain-containing protein [Propionicicella superfundia]|uniref:DUF4253 domain-containing protein n=1 Tax=Propionicicella superfundia TaxID=348582 RepID=UPI000404D326|nr:DUF4253 domain-containing protein [Propionicicella superfundia]
MTTPWWRRGRTARVARIATLDAVPRTERPGDLGELGGIDLPPGRMVVPDDDLAATADARPVAWITTGGDLRALWRRLVAAFPQTGLWPILAQGLEGDDVTRPWLDGELEGRHGTPGDVLEVLLRDAGGGPDGAAPRAGMWPLTRPAAAIANLPPVEVVHPGPVRALMLVEAARPADVPWALGWLGACNAGLTGADLTAVLRSWEDRFGAVLVGLSFDAMLVKAAAVPSDPGELAALCAEHYAFCPDNVDQGTDTMEAYLPALRSRDWYFWWD